LRHGRSKPAILARSGVDAAPRRSNGSRMKDRRFKDTAGADTKDSRHDRLKLALRENLKRRKAQARGRSDAGPSGSADASLDDGGGEKPDA